MKYLSILVLLLIASLQSSAQTWPSNYTRLNSNYYWRMGAFDALNLPTRDTSLLTGQWVKAGSIIFDSTQAAGSRVWVYNGTYWERLGAGGEGGGLSAVYGENGLTAVNDSTLRLGGTLLDTTNINIPQATRFRLLANGANGYMEDNQKPPWLVFKSSDTINTYAYANVGAATFFQQNVYFNNNRTDYFKGHEFWSEWRNADSTRVYSVGGDFGFVARNTLSLTRDAADDSRRVFLGGTVDFDAVPNTIAWTRLQRPTGHSSPIRARGWWSGFTAYPINLWGADTLDNYIAFASFGQIGATAKVLKYYDFYGAGGGYADNRVDSAWSLFSNREKQRVYHAGPVAFGGGNTGPTEALELVGNFKHFNLRSSNAADDSMVVWNETDKMYGKRPISAAGLLFARTDARNETEAAMNFSAAAQDFSIDSVGTFNLQSYDDGLGLARLTLDAFGNSYLTTTQSNNDYTTVGSGIDDARIQASESGGNTTRIRVTFDTAFIQYTVTAPVGYDTTLYKLQARNVVTGSLIDTYWPVGGGGSTNLGNTDLTQSSATRNYDIDDQNLYWLNTGTWRIYGSGTYSGSRLLEIDGTNSLGYFGPDAGSVFWGFNADSLLIDGIGLRNDTVNNKILVYNPNTNTVSYSNWIGGGGGSSGPSFGTDNQVPFTNSAGTNFDYSSGFTFNGTTLTVNSGADVNAPNALIIATSTRSMTIGPGVAGQGIIQNTGLDNNAGITLRTRLSVDMGVFARDVVYFQTNNSDRLRIGLTELVINEPGNNYDVRIEGDTDANLFFSDASTDRIGIGTATPGFKLDVNGMINTPGTETATYRWNTTATEVPATTTYAAPTNYIGSSTNYALFTPDAWLRVSVAGTLYGIPAYIITAP